MPPKAGAGGGAKPAAAQPKPTGAAPSQATPAAAPTAQPSGGAADDGKSAPKVNPKYAHLPPNKLAVRAKEGVQLLVGPFGPAYQKPTTWLHPNAVIADTTFSADGALWAVPTTTGVHVYDVTGTEPVARFVVARAHVAMVAFSAAATYLVCYEEKTSDGSPHNLTVWATGHTVKQVQPPAGDDAAAHAAPPLPPPAKPSSAKAGAQVAAFAQAKIQFKAAWPVLRWDDSELIAARLVAGGVELLDGDLAAAAAAGDATSAAGEAATTGKKKVLGKISMEGVQHFSIAPRATPIALATFAPTKKDMPGKVQLWEYPAALAAPKASKSLFTDECDMRWHPHGLGVLVHSSSETGTKDSYYGNSGLHVLTTDGKVSVTIAKADGAASDAQWNPNGREFVAIQGTQPAKARAYNIQGNPHFEFGTASRNTIRFAPHGRFVMIGGFASMPGDMDFWDRNKKKIIAPAKDINSPKSFQWFPDSRCFVTATTRPRRVDNGFKIWSYAGELLYSDMKSTDELLQVAVCPAAHDHVYPDRPQSPRLTDKRLAPAKAAAAAAAAPKAYVPPHRRVLLESTPAAASASSSSSSSTGGGGASVVYGGSTSDIMKVHKANAGPRSLHSLEKATNPNNLLHVTPELPKVVTAATEKNRKRRERQKAQKQREAGMAVDDDEEAGDGDGAGADDAKAAAPAKAPVAVSALDETAKKVRNLTKKLKGLQELKERADAGEPLNDEQRTKLAGIDKLKAEIAALTKA